MLPLLLYSPLQVFSDYQEFLAYSLNIPLRYVILNCCKTNFRVLLKTHFCPLIFALTVVIEAINILLILPHLFRKDLKVSSSIMPLLNNTESQFSVSFASFWAISSLWTKSALLSAYFASAMFALIDDALRISCFVYSGRPFILEQSSVISTVNSIASSWEVFGIRNSFCPPMVE